MADWLLVDPTGTERSFATYYYFYIDQVSGGTAPPVEVFGTPYAVLPGEVADGERVGARDLFLTGRIVGTTQQTLNQRKAALFDALKPWRTGQTTRNSDPILIRYTGAVRTVELQCKYVGGFEGGYDLREGFTEKIALHFRAQEDPSWRATSNTTLTLDEWIQVATRYAIGTVNGEWNVLGPPTAATSGYPKCALHNGTALYVGGTFVDMDADNDLDYFCKYTAVGGWLKVASGGEGTGGVNSIVEAPNGLIYLGGGFTNWGGDGDRDYVCSYNPSTDAYGDVGTGPGAGVAELAINPANGYLYATADETVKYWNGAAWTDLTAAFTGGDVNTICFAPDGTLYAGGIIADGVDFDGFLRKYDGSTWTTIVQSDAGDQFLSVRPLSDGRIVVAGTFDGLGGVTLNNIGIYNGQTFIDMGGGIGTGSIDIIFRIAIDSDDRVYACGTTSTVADVSIWNGSTWNTPDITWPANAVLDIAFNGDDVYYVGSFNDATVEMGGDVTSSASGTYVNVYPTITIANASTAIGTLKYLGNHTLGLEIFYDLVILPGETVTLNFADHTITSSTGRAITGNPLAGSADEFYIRGASNVIREYIELTAAGWTSTATYRMHYDGYEGGDVT